MKRLEFFADAVAASATQAASSARRLLDLATTDGQRIEKLGRAASSALAIHRALQRQPIVNAATLAKAIGLTPATVNKSLAHLERIGVVAELTGKQRGRVFSYARYVGILNEGMALPEGRRRA
jgi:Fic family protein